MPTFPLFPSLGEQSHNAKFQSRSNDPAARYAFDQHMWGYDCGALRLGLYRNDDIAGFLTCFAVPAIRLMLVNAPDAAACNVSYVSKPLIVE